jgi:molybdopterin molybdotransferase
MNQLYNELARRIQQIDCEMVPSNAALGRIVAKDSIAQADYPRFDESLRDGFVICNPKEDKEEFAFPIIAEIAAGVQKVRNLEEGCCCRIYTGGLIPSGADRVLPFEICTERSNTLNISAKTLIEEKHFYIKKRASEVHLGEIVIPAGVRIGPEHLSLLFSTGIAQVMVREQPKVACYCTGNELVKFDNGDLRKGQKISLNSLLLQKQLPFYGAEVVENELVGDEERLLTTVFERIYGSAFDVVVTTGGMGPGKYDLVRKIFVECGGEIWVTSLPMQPGKAVLVGAIDGKVFIALPGPPHAVRTLVNELVGPLLLMMQGVEKFQPHTVHAQLLATFHTRKSDILQVKSGVLSIDDGVCKVGLTGRLDTASCYILFPPGRHEFLAGERVEVHLAGGLAFSLFGHF